MNDPFDPDPIAHQIPLFLGLEGGALAAIGDLASRKVYNSQALVVGPTEWGREVLFIVEGWLEVATQVEEVPQTLEIFGQGAHIGTMAVLDDHAPLHTAIALTRTELLTLPAQRFLQLLIKYPSLQQRLLQLTNQRLRHLYLRLKAMGQSGPRRIMKTLIYLGENYGKVGGHGLEIVAVTPLQLAQMVNCDPEEVATVLANLVHHGLLEQLPDEHCYCLPYVQKLRQFAKQF